MNIITPGENSRKMPTCPFIGKIIRIQGGRGSGIQVKRLRIRDTTEGNRRVERMLKGLAKSLERKALDPLNP
jgi:hypothetical protein